MDWLDSKPDHSVVYLCFGSLAHVKDAQLDELAAGLESSGKSFLWVVRGKEAWGPPKGWEERVQDKGLIIRAWAPQTAILAHRAVGAFVMQCGWNSILESRDGFGGHHHDVGGHLHELHHRLDYLLLLVPTTYIIK